MSVMLYLLSQRMNNATCCVYTLHGQLLRRLACPVKKVYVRSWVVSIKLNRVSFRDVLLRCSNWHSIILTQKTCNVFIKSLSSLFSGKLSQGMNLAWVLWGPRSLLNFPSILSMICQKEKTCQFRTGVIWKKLQFFQMLQWDQERKENSDRFRGRLRKTRFQVPPCRLFNTGECTNFYGSQMETVTESIYLCV